MPHSPAMTAASRRSRFAAVAPLLFIFLWSSAFVAVRAGLPDVSPIYFLSIRFTLAALILLLIAAATRPVWHELAGRWQHFVVSGVLINALYLSGGYLAMARISGATFALIGALHPILVALLSIPFLGDRFTARQWLGFALGLAGVALVVGVNAGDATQLEGIGIGVLGLLCFVAGTLYYARYCRAAGLVLANMVQLGAAAVVCWLFVLLFETPRADWTPAALVTLLHLTIGVSLGGMALLLYMLRSGTAGKVAANFYLTPGLAAVLGWLILDEALSPAAIVGFAVASAGVWLVNRG